MADHNELIALIDSHINPPDNQEMLMGAVSALPQQNFCTIWPQAKPVLQLIGGLLQWVYPVGVPILNGLIAVGDQLYAAGCQTK